MRPSLHFVAVLDGISAPAGGAEDAAAQHDTTFRQWRENPAAFGIGDRYPVDEVFAEAKNAWQRAPAQHKPLIACR